MLAPIQFLLVPALLVASNQSAGLQLGDRWTQLRTMRFVNEAEEIDLADVERIESKVIGQTPTGHIVSVSRTLVETRIGEDRIPPAAGVEPYTWSYELRANGAEERLDRSHDVFEERVGRIWRALLPEPGEDPLKAPDEWRRAYEDRGARLPGATVRIEVLERQDDRLRLRLRYAEPGSLAISAEGTATVLLRSRVVLEMEIEARNVPLPGGEDTATLRLTQKTQSARVGGRDVPILPRP
jgi:hypothetical protein